MDSNDKQIVFPVGQLAWRTKYSQEEFNERALITLTQVGLSNMSSNRFVEDDKLVAESISWLYALENIPTSMLERSFTVAIQDHKGDHPMVAAAVKRAYEEIRELEVATANTEKEWEEQGDGRDPGINYLGADYSRISAAIDFDNPVDAVKRDRWEAISPRDFWRIHNLPDTWKLGDPYPPESDLYNKPVPEPQKPKVPERGSEGYRILTNERPAKWHKRDKMPWELYPSAENPQVSRVTVTERSEDEYGYASSVRVLKEFVWWVDRCSEMDNPVDECPGFVVVHQGVNGEDVNKLPCPFHSERWN